MCIILFFEWPVRTITLYVASTLATKEKWLKTKNLNFSLLRTIWYMILNLDEISDNHSIIIIQ